MNEPWIYLVLLGAVIAVFGWLRPEKASNESTDTTLFQRNMEETLEHYVQEVAADNDRLLDVVERMKQEQAACNEASRRRMDKLETAIHMFDEKLELWKATVGKVQPAVHITPSTGNQIEEHEDELQVYLSVQEERIERPLPSIRDRYPELFNRLAEGVTPAAAGMELNLPLGEIQLIMQLAEQEDNRV